MRQVAALGVLLLGTFLQPAPSQGKDWFLTIGGGYSPSGNQISIEKNIAFFQGVLAKNAVSGDSHELLFSDGKALGRDVQFEPAKSRIPKANLYFAKVFSSDRNLHLEYRDHQLVGVDAPTSVGAIETWFRETGSELTPGDRVIVYVSAHGGRSADKKNPHDTKLYLWNTKVLYAKRFADLIKGLPDGVAVVMVMTQCYSGGYAHTLFEEANAKKGDQGRPVAGFFSTVHNRMAAGCTPDINEENYDEYSSHFLAAIHGATRTGKQITVPDYDEDGGVSFEEAHAYTILESQTIDIPIKTSGAYLRERAKFGGEENPALLEKGAGWETVRSLARPVDAVVLDRLSESLQLSGEARHADATKKAAEVDKERKDLLNVDKAKKRTWDSAKSEIRNAFIAQWPEMSNLATPEAIGLIADSPERIVEIVESHPRFSEWKRIEKERDQNEAERLVLEKKWVQYQRFLRCFENVVLEENLKRAGDPGALANYERILREEAKSLGGSKLAP